MRETLRIDSTSTAKFKNAVIFCRKFDFTMIEGISPKLVGLVVRNKVKINFSATTDIIFAFSVKYCIIYCRFQ